MRMEKTFSFSHREVFLFFPFSLRHARTQPDFFRIEALQFSGLVKPL